MKKIHLLLIAAASLTIFASCGEKMPDEPTKGFAWYDASEYAAENKKNPSPDTVYTGQGITFVSTQNNADTYVVWPGDPGFAYADREGNIDETDTTNQVSDKSQGIALAERYGEYSSKVPYVYDTVGDFTVTFVARNIYKNKDGDLDYVESVEEKTITVIDTLAELEAPQGFEDKYDFVVISPKSLQNTRPTFDSDKKEVTFSFDEGTDVSAITLLIKAHTSNIELEDAENPIDDPRLGLQYDWYKVDLTSNKKLTVSALSPGYDKVWTVKTVFEPAPVPAP